MLAIVVADYQALARLTITEKDVAVVQNDGDKPMLVGENTISLEQYLALRVLYMKQYWAGSQHRELRYIDRASTCRNCLGADIDLDIVRQGFCRNSTCEY
ncbi:hypothetical protein ACI77I_31765 [Pseudomonas sp. D47]|uniref:hypothetical protein n=1 Tax=Pseudomonas sp. D47 TaxID=3159447 RepID=UPI00387B0347